MSVFLVHMPYDKRLISKSFYNALLMLVVDQPNLLLVKTFKLLLMESHNNGMYQLWSPIFCQYYH